MSIHQRRDAAVSRWQVRWRDREGRQRSRSFRTRREAVQFEAATARAMQLDADVPARTRAEVKLADWLETWHRVHGPTWAPSTRRGRAMYCDRWIAPYLGGMLIGSITRGDVNRWRAAILRDGASADTANHALRVLSAAMGRAVDDDLIAGNPCAGVRAMRHLVERPRALATMEVWRLIAACTNSRDRRMIGLMAFAGLRPAEVLAIRWDDIDGGVIHVARSVRIDGSVSTPKSRHGRTIVVEAILEPLIADGGTGLICPRLDRGTHLQWRSWYRHQWVPIRRRSGVVCAPYDMRHTYASRRIALGDDVVTVAHAMGHADPAMTLRRYAHLFARRSHAASSISRTIRP